MSARGRRLAWLLPLALGALLGCGRGDSAASTGAGGDEAREAPQGLSRFEWGELLFQEHGCASCHHINGVRGIGGSLDAIWHTSRPLADGSEATVDEAYLRESILDPGAKVVAGFEASMPSYEGVLEEAEVEALVHYVRELR